MQAYSFQSKILIKCSFGVHSINYKSNDEIINKLDWIFNNQEYIYFFTKCN